MKILFHIPGELNDGMDSYVRGEGRWSLNFAHMMGQQGHEVVCFGSPGQGEVPGCRVVGLNDPILFETEWDVLADSTWLASRAAEIDAKVNLGLYWGFDGVAAAFRQKHGRDHWVGLATTQQYSRIPESVKDFVKLVPCPIAREIQWEHSNALAPNLFVSWKWAFEDAWEARRSIMSHRLLHIALDLAEEFDLRLHIFHAEHVFGGYPGVKVNMRPDLAERLRTHSKVIAHPRAPWRDAMEILASSRLAIMNFEPPISPMPVEAAAFGTIPMQEKTNIFEIDGPYIFNYIADESYIETYIRPRLHELCSQPETYNALLAEMREHARLYTYAEAYPVCLRSLEEMLGAPVS